MKLIEQIKKHQRKMALAGLVAYALLALPLAVNQCYGVGLHWIMLPIWPVPIPIPYLS